MLAQTAAADPTLVLKVRSLVTDLNDEEKAVRDEAERELVALGPAILDLLPEVDPSMPAEQAVRIGRVRVQLERLQAEKSVEASLITLDAANLPLADALAAFRAQSGNRLIDYRESFGQKPAPIQVSAQFNQVPFWPALDQLLDRTGLTLYGYSNEVGLTLVTSNPNQRPRYRAAAYAGAFRIGATELSSHRDVRQPDNDHLQVRLETAWEPRLKPIVLLQSLTDIQARDDRGEAIKIAGGEETLEINLTPENSLVEYPLLFQLPPRDAQRIASLKGRFRVLLPGRLETYRFSDLTRGGGKREQRKAGVTVVVDEVRRNQQLWEIRLRVVFDNPHGALESHRTWVFNNPAYLESADGTPVTYDALETTRQTETEVGLALLFARDDLDGMSLVYQSPGVVLDLPVEFELTDLPLP